MKKWCMCFLVAISMVMMVTSPPAETSEPETNNIEEESVTETDQTDTQETIQIEEEPQSKPSLENTELVSLGEFKLTAYCSCVKCCGKWAIGRPVDESGNPIIYTASGAVAKEGETISVDPSLIPLGTEVIIDGRTYIAQDTGSAVKGNVIDVYFASHETALEFGRQFKEVKIKAAS